MENNSGFMAVITNKIKTPSVFHKNTEFCFESLYQAVKRIISESSYICKDFYFDSDKMQDKYKIKDFFKTNHTLPVLFISQDCFNIDKKIINNILEKYKKIGDIAVFDRNESLFAYVISPENKTAALDKYENLHLDIDNDILKRCNVDYTVPSTFKELREISQKTQEHILANHEENGVQFISFDGVVISSSAKIGKNVVIYPGTIIKGDTVVGDNTVLGPNTLIDNSVIGEDCVINSTQIYSSIICDDVKIGPFCHIRPNCRIASGVRIGDFVEVKNSNIGKDTHASHLTYIGDSDVGERVNFGCGTVTVNYDGVDKHRCYIADDAFIGCNTNLIAPISIGEGAYTAAGSTLSIDVPPDALAVARAREQKIIDGWVSKYKRKK